MGASLLTTLGLQEEWLASTEEDYLGLAVKAAQDIPKLSQLRSSLRDRMLASPLCDGPGFVKQLEDVYQNLWDKWQREASD